MASAGRSDDEGPFGGGGTGPNPTDRAKAGTKRSLQTDGAGVPIGLVVAGANERDMKLFEATLRSGMVRRPGRSSGTQHLCLDREYDYVEIHEIAAKLRYKVHARWRMHGPQVPRQPGRRKPRRWVVERTHSWMNRFRRILIRWEKYLANYEAMLHWVCGCIAFRAAGVSI